jgi:hypothetical protein
MRACIISIVGLSFIALLAPTAAARDPWVGQRVYGYQLMSRDEVIQYQATIRAFETHDEKLAFWRSEIERIQQRAMAWGVQLPDPPRYRALGEERKARDREPYFVDIMTEEEVEEYYSGLEALETVSERRAFKADHITRMRARGFARGISLLGTHDWDYVFENGERPPDVIP